jgi:3-dehydroquinate synthetase
VSDSDIQLGAGLLADVGELDQRAGGVLLLTDSNVEALVPTAWQRLPRHVIAPGEQSKCWAELERLLLALDAASLDRDGLLLALGGGVVTDLGGFAASLHRRGIAWHALPTSLIGQVDAAVGGKTAVNFAGGKNGVGTVHLPERVTIDPTALASLPLRHLLSGMAEVLKTALIAGSDATSRALSLSPGDFAAAAPAAVVVIQECVATKQRLVSGDLHDHGQRRLLNLGHTFGHALEAAALGACTHGEAVGLGLLCAARFSGAAALEQTLRDALGSWGLPTSSDTAPGDLAAQLGRDKKRRSGALTVVELRNPGEVDLRPDVPLAEVLEAFEAVLDRS